jgi:archaellum biogenesis ATPase FlaH
LEEGEFASLSDIGEDVEEPPRLVIGGRMSSVDDILGGGIVEGAVVLLTGDPGIGKSTLVLQILQELSKNYKVLYAVGEETVKKVLFRSKRIGKFNQRLLIGRETQLENIFEKIESLHAKLVVIDSLHTIRAFSETTGDELEVGSTTALRIGMQAIADYASKMEITFILIGHVNKESGIAGPRTLEHACDVAIHFESRSANKRDPIRVLRCDHKNRDGDVPKYAHFEMTAKGLVPWEEPSEDEDAEDEPEIITHRPSRRLRALPSIAPTPAALPAPEASWATPDGIPATTVLAVPCDIPDCRGTVGRACTAADGSREKGFHQTRIEKARGAIAAEPLAETPEIPLPPDPFEKKFGAPPKLKAARTKKRRTELPPVR